MWIAETPCPQRPPPCCQLEDLFVYVFVLSLMRSRPGPSFLPARPRSGARLLQRRRSWRSIPGARAAGPPQRGRVPTPRWPATGRTCSRYTAAPKRAQPAGPLAVGRVRAVPRGAGGPPARRRTASRSTPALPVKHASRRPRPRRWTGPNGLHARFGRDAAHAEWFYGFRLAARPTWAAASCGPGASCPPPSASVTWAPTCWKPAAAPRPARDKVQRQGVRRVPGRLRHAVLSRQRNRFIVPPGTHRSCPSPFPELPHGHIRVFGAGLAQGAAAGQGRSTPRAEGDGAAATGTAAASALAAWPLRAAFECSWLSREEIRTAARIAPATAKPAPTRNARSKPLVSATAELWTPAWNRLWVRLLAVERAKPICASVLLG